MRCIPASAENGAFPGHKGRPGGIRCGMDWQRMIPGSAGIPPEAWAEAREIRLYPGRPVTVCCGEKTILGNRALTPAEVTQAAQALSRHALAARREETARGFLPLPGGHRLGICGIMGADGLREITSLCLRPAREIRGAAAGVYPLLRDKSVLIVGPPGSGKTTLLRDLVRLLSLDGLPVGVADERGEIAACRDGAPQLDVGPMTDVVTGLPRRQAFSLLIRAMSPRVIAADEMDGREDAAAVREAARCGVRVVATAHGASLADIRRRPGLGALLRAGVFERAAVLAGAGKPPRIEAVREEEPWES